VQISFNISELVAATRASHAIGTADTETVEFHQAAAFKAAIDRARQVFCTPGVMYSDSVRAAVMCRLLDTLAPFEDRQEG